MGDRNQRRRSFAPAGRDGRVAAVVRVGVFATIVGLIHWQHTIQRRQLTGETLDWQVLLGDVREELPNAAGVMPSDSNLSTVYDGDDELIGYATRTLPGCHHIIGFSGPTDVLLLFDPERRLTSARVLSSGDTKEHVAAVVKSPLLDSLVGQTAEELQAVKEVDAVSGATLTSLAVVESIRCALAGPAERRVRSLRFPDPLIANDVESLFAGAQQVQPLAGGMWEVTDSGGEVLGVVLRTSPTVDNLIGYQGPTDTWIAFDPMGQVTGIAIGSSYDNEPYVSYVRDDKYFRGLFDGLTVEQLAKATVAEKKIEGVSGATMTSVAVAEGIFAAAADYMNRVKESDRELQRTPSLLSHVLWQPRNLSTLAITVLGAVVGLTALKHRRHFRLMFQCLLIVWLGWFNGDFVSQAFLLGWAENGITLQPMFGLALLNIAAVVFPIATGKNVYCAHLCPHGAVQQLLRHRLQAKVRLPRRWQYALRAIPVALLAWVASIGMLDLPFSPVDIEPFDAWVWRIAGALTIAIAVAGLAISCFVPMAYCRFGCPTGALLNYLRCSGRSGWSRRDSVGIALLCLALLLFFAGR